MTQLFVLEGGDACGKATQAKLLSEALNTRIISFPRYTASETGRLIDDMLHKRLVVSFGMKDGKDPKADQTMGDPRLLQALMTWDRYSCTDLWEAPENALVLDRYWMSGCVYGALDGIPVEELLQAHRGLPAPKVAFFMDLPVEVQMERLAARGRVPDRYEAKEGLRERLQTIHDLYQKIWEVFGPDRFPHTDWVIIDGTTSVEAVAARIAESIQASKSAV